VAALLLATWALVATSPPQEPVQKVQDRSQVGLDLSEDAPVGTVNFTVSASDEALWSDDVEISPTSGTVSLDAHVPRPAGPQASSSPMAGTAPILGVRLLRDDVEVGTRPNYGAVDPSSVTFDLRAACVENRDCELQLQAVVEWLNPAAGESLSAELVIAAEASIEGPETVPVGAQMALVVDPPETPKVTVVGDAVASAPVSLDAERPMVTWSVDVTTNPEALSQPLGWPIDPSAVISLDIAVPDASADEYRYREPPVRLLLIVAGQEMPLRPASGNLQHELPLFRCGTGPCDERVTLVAQWTGQSADDAITLGWELHAGLTFHDPASPKDGAEVRLGDPVRTDIHRDGPAVRATVEGSIPLFDEDDPSGCGPFRSTSRRLRWLPSASTGRCRPCSRTSPPRPAARSRYPMRRSSACGAVSARAWSHSPVSPRSRGRRGRRRTAAAEDRARWSSASARRPTARAAATWTAASWSCTGGSRSSSSIPVARRFPQVPRSTSS
jgi:hypothetical protein